MAIREAGNALFSCEVFRCFLVEIVDTGVLEDPGGWRGGRLGLFSKSQAGVTWSSITAHCEDTPLEY